MSESTKLVEYQQILNEKIGGTDNASDIFDRASTDGGGRTPSRSSETSLNDGRPRTADSAEPAFPWPGETFIIRLRDTGQTVTLVDGRLELCDEFRPEGGCHWRCEEKDGWFGFRNCVSGTYIGHDGKKKFIAKVSHHREHEYFCVRFNPKRGGFELLTRHGPELWRMNVGQDGKTLVETKGDSVTWDFFKLSHGSLGKLIS
ncbi:hypothetical protein BGZ63DRAFT_47157 [Mariannaea sp. PMI_226]|nr:hypothetical protein BGZ63DRAFT_47157 [Mariannaea sp. PMI_226]